jgi:hypothetical protein
LQLRGVPGLGIAPQKFQRDEAIQSCVARFKDRSHPADTERFDENEIIERTFHAKFLAALWTGNARERFGVARINLRTASRTRLHLSIGFALGHQPILTSACRSAMSLDQ